MALMKAQGLPVIFRARVLPSLNLCNTVFSNDFTRRAKRGEEKIYRQKGTSLESLLYFSEALAETYSLTGQFLG
jgi:hypothetical protein